MSAPTDRIVPPDDSSSRDWFDVPLSVPNLGETERREVWRALTSTQIAYGPVVDRFEHTVAELHGRRGAVAVSSGTAAVHLALLAAGVRAGDEVLMPTLTFVAPANAVCYVGAHPILFDAEPEYRQLDVARLASWAHRECRRDTTSTTIRRGSRRRVGAILAVDLLGHPCDLDSLRIVADELEVPLILDAAQSLGATVHDRKLGDRADLVCLSFNANKIVTTAGGGMILSDDDEQLAKVRYLANHAKARGDAYVHPDIGFNYRMASAQAALGNVQIARLDEFVQKKREIASWYDRELGELPGLTCPTEAPWARSTYWLYTVHIDPALSGRSISQIADQLYRRRIASRPMFTPLHQVGVHVGREAEPCPVAELLGGTGLTLPTSTSIGPVELAQVAEAIHALWA